VCVCVCTASARRNAGDAPKHVSEPVASSGKAHGPHVLQCRAPLLLWFAHRDAQKQFAHKVMLSGHAWHVPVARAERARRKYARAARYECDGDSRAHAQHEHGTHGVRSRVCEALTKTGSGYEDGGVPSIPKPSIWSQIPSKLAAEQIR
jgi:hypothetical protein